MLTVFGLALFAFFFFGMQRVQACRWRYLAESYARDAGARLGERKMRSVVLIGLGGFNSVKGITTIGVHTNGVSLRVMPIFSLFHEPLFVPFGDIRGWRTTWYLDARSSELHLRRAPDVKIVLPEEDAEWIRSHAGSEMMLRDTRPPGGNVGRGWHVFSLVHCVFGLFAVLVVIAMLIGR